MSAAEAVASPHDVLLAVEGVTKHFAGVTALSDVSLDVRRGEILGLLGENGAGKSTLLKILSGVMPPSSGRVVFDGAEYSPDSPQDAKRLGIVTIYQELSLIPTLTVAENIFVGRAPIGRLGLVDWRRMEEASRGIIARVGLTIDPLTPVSALSVAEQQLVEIARALSLESRLIIMDEPTSALTETEVQRLLSIMDRLRKDGVAIMFVTHRLEEASAICDRMTVLRDGKLAGHLNREGKPVPLPRIIEKMVGRAASELYARPTQRDVAGDVRLSIRGLRTMRDPEAPHAIVLEGIDLDLKAGEILGVAGLVGSGRTELARAIFGADRIAAGTITLDGQPIALPRRPTLSRSASGWFRRTASARRSSRHSASCPISRSPRSARTATALASWPSGASERRWPISARCCRSAWPRPSRRSRGCPAATSRRSCWPAGWRATRKC